MNFLRPLEAWRLHPQITRVRALRVAVVTVLEHRRQQVRNPVQDLLKGHALVWLDWRGCGAVGRIGSR